MPTTAKSPTIRIWAVEGHHRVGESIDIRGEVIADGPDARAQLVSISLVQGKMTWQLHNVEDDPSTDLNHYPFHAMLAPVARPGIYVVSCQGFCFFRTPGLDEREDPGRTEIINSKPIKLQIEGSKS